jgi:hypothetical protein
MKNLNESIIESKNKNNINKIKPNKGLNKNTVKIRA